MTPTNPSQELIKLFFEEMSQLMAKSKQRNPKGDLLNRGQAAKYLVDRGAKSYTSKALANLASRGLGPPYIKLGNQVYYTEQDLDTWIMKQRIVPIGFYHDKEVTR